MNLNSIRRRLPFSYAAIALLAALTLGVVLIATIRGYYNKQERSYLQGNAEQISFVIARLLEAHIPAKFLQDQVTSWSFLSQARIQVLDPDRKVLADSGVPSFQQVMMISDLAAPRGDVFVERVESPGEAGVPVTLPSWGLFVINGDLVTEAGAGGRATGCYEPTPGTAGASECLTREPVFDKTLPWPQMAYSAITETITGSVGAAFSAPVGISMSMSPSLYGYDFEATGSSTQRRSRQKVEQPVIAESGDLLVTVVLSDGPAYGDEIVSSVSRAWLVASVIAVILAAGAGWLVSRQITEPLQALTSVTTRMAAGDLSARAGVESTDELGALGAAFNEMAGRVEEMVRTLRNFVADAAHELHTPLTALRTNLELASAEPDSRQQASLIEAAQGQIARLEGVISGLLDLSRLDAHPGEHASIDLVETLRDIIEPCASRAEQLDVRFDFNLPDRPVYVRGNADLLKRAAGNLLDNALKFTPPGGTVSLSLSAVEEAASITVEDSGIGIPDEDLPRLFQRFHRGRNASGYEGSGLGLAIVRAIVLSHGGDVWEENTHPGARFRIDIPYE
ncbi:MAG: sensor histidine kinase [Chloroflexota bacterium]|nr:MAG: sensor histidine kinase [Chloroflexota bacterium]